MKTVKPEARKRTRCQPCISPQSLIGIRSHEVSISQTNLQLQHPPVFLSFHSPPLPPLPPRAPLPPTVTLSDPLFAKSAVAPLKSSVPSQSSPHSHSAPQLAGALGGVSAPKLPTSSALPGGILIGEMKGETHSQEGPEWEVRSGDRAWTPQEHQS